jgi:hypothetical protein
MGAMRALLLAFTCMTLTVGWAARAEPARPARAACVERHLSLLVDPFEMEAAAVSSSASDFPSSGDAASGRPTHASREKATADAPGDGPDPPGRRIPFHLEIVDGESGAPLAPEPGTALEKADGLDPSDAGPWFPGSYGALQATNVSIEARLPAPEGYVADAEGKYAGRGLVSRRATFLRLLAPLRHEADIRVRVVNSAGDPVRGARANGAYLGGPEPRVVEGSPDEIPEDCGPPDGTIDMDFDRPETITCRSDPSGEDGWIRVRGLPHLLDERFWVVARADEREAFAGITLGALGERHEAEIRLAGDPSHVSRDLAYCFGGGSG